MPYVGWQDTTRGTQRPFGSEWSWKDAPVGPEMLAAIVAKIMNDRAHEYDKLTPTTILQTPRQILIERFMDCYVDPEQFVSMQIGTMLHEILVKELVAIGYSTEPLKLKAYGVEMEGSPDAYWPPYKVVRKMSVKEGDQFWAVDTKPELGVLPGDLVKVLNPKPFDGMQDIVELKVTTPGSVKFIMQDGKPKKDHSVQVNLYREAYVQAYGGDPEQVTARISYYDMPQKEQVAGMGWIRMPPCLTYPVDYMDLDYIGEVRPGYDPPTRSDKGYQGPPPPTVKENVATLVTVMQMIRDGVAPEQIVKQLECHCPKRFSGTGRSYCNVSGRCAFEDHQTFMW